MTLLGWNQLQLLVLDVDGVLAGGGFKLEVNASQAITFHLATIIVSRHKRIILTA